MRIRILKIIATKLGGFNPGEVVNVPKKLGQSWCDSGLAEQEKSQDGAKETKTDKVDKMKEGEE